MIIFFALACAVKSNVPGGEIALEESAVYGAGALDVPVEKEDKAILYQAQVRDGWLLTEDYHTGRVLRSLDDPSVLVSLPPAQVSGGGHYSSLGRHNVMMPGGAVVGVEGVYVVVREVDGSERFRRLAPGERPPPEEPMTSASAYNGTPKTMTSDTYDPVRFEASEDGRILVHHNQWIELLSPDGALLWETEGPQAGAASRLSPSGERVMLLKSKGNTGATLVELSGADGSVQMEQELEARILETTWWEGGDFYFSAVSIGMLNEDEERCDAKEFGTLLGFVPRGEGTATFTSNGTVLSWQGCGEPLEEIARIPVVGGIWLQSLLAAPEGYLAVYHTGEVLALTPDFEPIGPLPLFGYPSAIALSEDGEKLAVWNSDGGVQIVDRVGDGDQALSLRQEFQRQMVFSPDGMSLYVGGAELHNDRRGRRVSGDFGYRIDLATGEEHRFPTNAVTAAWTPSGELLVPSFSNIKRISAVDEVETLEIDAGCDLIAVGMDDGALIGVCGQDERAVLSLDGAESESLGLLGEGKEDTNVTTIHDLPGAGNFAVVSGGVQYIAFEEGEMQEPRQIYGYRHREKIAGTSAGMLGLAMVHNPEWVPGKLETEAQRTVLQRLEDDQIADVSLDDIQTLAASGDGQWLGILADQSITVMRVDSLAFQPPPKPGALEITAITASDEDYDTELMRESLDSSFRRTIYCYRNILLDDPSAVGEITMTFTAEPRPIKEKTITADSLADRGFGECVDATTRLNLYRAGFEEPMETEVTLRFTPE